MAEEALEKLASEMTDRIAALEKENAELKAKLATADEALTKKASEDNAPKTVVPAEVADATVEALLKYGALLPEQADESKQVLLKDAAAAHRVLVRILDAQIQTKKASAGTKDDFDVAGGTLANAPEQKPSAQEDCMDRMMTILKLK
jgi:alanyl-tRNA synthetase